VDSGNSVGDVLGLFVNKVFVVFISLVSTILLFVLFNQRLFGFGKQLKKRNVVSDFHHYFAEVGVDRQSQGLGDWVITKNYVEELKNNSSCETLENIHEKQKKLENDLEKEGKWSYDFSLPSVFDRPNMCGVIKKVDKTIFYVIGIDTGFEVVVYNGLLEEELNADINAWKGEYFKNNPEIEWPNKEYLKMSDLTDDKINGLFENPSVKMNDSFILLKDIANSIN